MPRPYREVAEELRRRIKDGTYTAKSPLPSERALVAEFEIHRATVRRALNLLAAEGLVSRQRGHRAYAGEKSLIKDHSIGLFASEPTDPFARSLIANGLSELLTQRRSAHRLIWSNYHRFELDPYKHDEDDLAPPTDRLAALLLWPPRMVSLDLLVEARKHVPVLLLDRRVNGFESDFVGFQDAEAGYLAAKHLYEVGHRKLAFVGDGAFETTAARRYGFKKFCRDAGIEPYWTWATLGSVSDLPETMQRAWSELAKDTWPTAALCANDETAAHMISFLAAYGRRVPDDLAMVGFGGAQPGLLSAIGLTTMEQPYVEMGRVACDIVLERIESHRKEPYRDVHLPMKLRVRTSCGSTLVRAS
ncbi:MAG TPA: GntR family transcriptional regulator [Fimbriimonadaceae bacterium]|jgi:DNA-binding LacI/PurR family transcriptional regulator